MPRTRLSLHEIFCNILGSRNCYFSPPSDIHMLYPCIKYDEDNTYTAYADNKNYKKAKRYTVTVIDPNPDSDIPDQLLELPFCSSDRVYQADGLNHFVFTIFY